MGKTLASLDQFLSRSSLSTLASTISLSGTIGSTVATALAMAGASVGASVSVGTSILDGMVSGSSGDFFSGSAPRTTLANLVAGMDPLPDSSGSLPDAMIPSSQGSTNGGTTLSYPPDMGKYFLQLTFYKYSRPAPLEPGSTDQRGSISLPIPDNLVEDFQLGYENKALGIIGNIADNWQRHTKTGSTAQQAESFMTEGALRSTDAVTQFLSHATSTKNLSGINLDTGALSGAAEQYLGAIPNPSLAVLFSGVAFRKHSFRWLMAPKSPQESQTLRAIIKMLKVNALPPFSQGVTNILDYPNIVQPMLFPWGPNESSDTYTYKFKRCVIESINVNYNPQNSPAFFAETTAPAFIGLTLNLQEIEYFTAEDFGGSGTQLSISDAFRQLTGGISGSGS
jgi:hypothetical protein